MKSPIIPAIFFSNTPFLAMINNSAKLLSFLMLCFLMPCVEINAQVTGYVGGEVSVKGADGTYDDDETSPFDNDGTVSLSASKPGAVSRLNYERLATEATMDFAIYAEGSIRSDTNALAKGYGVYEFHFTRQAIGKFRCFIGGRCRNSDAEVAVNLVIWRAGNPRPDEATRRVFRGPFENGIVDIDVKVYQGVQFNPGDKVKVQISLVGDDGLWARVARPVGAKGVDFADGSASVKWISP